MDDTTYADGAPRSSRTLSKGWLTSSSASHSFFSFSVAIAAQVAPTAPSRGSASRVLSLSHVLKTSDANLTPVHLYVCVRAFGSDTEAGRLLKKLYCGNAKPKVSYPSTPNYIANSLHGATSHPLTLWLTPTTSTCVHAPTLLSHTLAEVTTKPREASAPFIPGGGANHADSRTHALAIKVSDRAIKAPSFTGRSSGPEVHPIDLRGVRRKPLSEIEKEVQQIKRQMEAYRISCIKYVVLLRSLARSPRSHWSIA